MSFHVVHLFKHGGSLHKDRGRLYFRTAEGQKSVPIENMRALIVAAKGITFSSQLISALLDVDCIILHCDEKYQPVGWTLPAHRTMHQDIILGQIRPRGKLLERLWQRVLVKKIEHQSIVLDYLDLNPNPLASFLDSPAPHEGGAARVYFKHFFQHLEARGQSRNQRHRGWLNAYLNYGYAVLTSMVHRSIVVHGMMSNIGIQHKMRYRSYPLVYDLMEPLRPIVDGLVVHWVSSWDIGDDAESETVLMEPFGRFIGLALREYRIKHAQYSLKLVDAIDFYIRSFAKAFQSQLDSELWIPHFDLQYLQNYHVKH